jgi:hypothetical protein
MAFGKTLLKKYIKGMPIVSVKKGKMILTFGKASLM